MSPSPSSAATPSSATTAEPRSYLSLGEPVGQIHLEKEEKQRGFPSGLVVEGGFRRKPWLGQAAGMRGGGITHSLSGWDAPDCVMTPADTPRPRDHFVHHPPAGQHGGFTPKPR